MINIRQRNLTALIAVLVLVAGFLAGQVFRATPANAVYGLYQVTSQPTSYNSQPFKYSEAPCNIGDVVVGGGASVDDDSQSGGKVPLVRLEPNHYVQGGVDRYRYIAEAREPVAGFAGNWFLVTYAICAPQTFLGYEIVPSPAASPSSQAFQSAKATCPTGKRVIGTGARVRFAGDGGDNGPGELGLQLSRSSGARDISRATAREDADGYSGTWTLSSYAVCAQGLAATVQGQVSNTAEAVARCGDSTQVHGAGGGGSLTDSGPVFLHEVIPYAGSNGAVKVSMTGPPVGGVAAQALCAA